MDIDLRLKIFRSRKDYWRQVREGRLPWPKYKKPVITAIKLDPEQAIIAACSLNAGIYFKRMTNTDMVCVRPSGQTAQPCNTSVRGAGGGGTGGYARPGDWQNQPAS